MTHGSIIRFLRGTLVPVRMACTLLAFGLAFAPAATAEPAAGRLYANPILPGDWSDPGLIRVGDTFYTVRSSFGWQPGLPVARSRDLVHWELIGHGFMSHPKLLPGDTRHGIWGVDMGWNPNTRQFLIYAPTRDGEVYVYHADRPEGPYAVKSLGQNLGIDPGFFADEDGRLYFLTNRALIYELESDGLSIKRPVVQIDRTPYRLFEGPAIFRREGHYYLLFSDGGTLPREPSTISVLRAPSLTGPWETDPGNPVMFSTDSGARFEGPAHGTLIETAPGEWYVAYHAHETAYSTLGRQFLMEPITWTADGWWRPVGGKIPTTSARAPSLPTAVLALQQSDEFDQPDLGLPWFFTCAPDFSGDSWSLRDRPGALRITTRPGTLHELEALPGVFQQRMIDKAFSFETRVTFDARSGREAAGLHMFHDPLMNLWLAVTVSDGKKRIVVGRHTLGVRTDLWSLANPYGDDPVHLRIVVTDPETATFHHSPDGTTWRQLGDEIYFGSSGHHLRDGRRGDPDLGWVGRYKEKGVSPVDVNGRPENQRQANRGGNIWTATTFGIFAVQDGAAAPKPAWFDHFRVTKTPSAPKPKVIVMTDGEIDDHSSMTRFLLYTSDVEVKAIIETNSMFQKNGHSGKSWYEDQLAAYEAVYPNLIKHRPGYPTADELRVRGFVGDENYKHLKGTLQTRWKQIPGGPVEFDPAGWPDTPGSDAIVRILLEDDPAPTRVHSPMLASPLKPQI